MAFIISDAAVPLRLDLC